MVAVVLGTAWTLAAAPGAAHHSFSAEFDVARPLTLTGSITKIEWTNPHAWLYIDVKDDKGNVRPWAMELSSANGLLRQGWTRDSVKIGEVVTVEGFGARDGTDTGNASAVTVASTGKRLLTVASSESN
jgi:hypothetical protein